MGAQRRKTDFENIACAATGVEGGAAAAVAVGVDQFVDRRVESGLLKRGR